MKLFSLLKGAARSFPEPITDNPFRLHDGRREPSSPFAEGDFQRSGETEAYGALERYAPSPVRCPGLAPSLITE